MDYSNQIKHKIGNLLFLLTMQPYTKHVTKGNAVTPDRSTTHLGVPFQREAVAVDSGAVNISNHSECNNVSTFTGVVGQSSLARGREFHSNTHLSVPDSVRHTQMAETTESDSDASVLVLFVAPPPRNRSRLSSP
jgi:hypothetical protein